MDRSVGQRVSSAFLNCVEAKYFTYDKDFRRVPVVQQKLDDLLSTSEVALKLGVTRQRVLELIKTDRLRAKKVGRSYVVHSNDVLSLSRFKVGRPTKLIRSSRENYHGSKLTNR